MTEATQPRQPTSTTELPFQALPSHASSRAIWWAPLLQPGLPYPPSSSQPQSLWTELEAEAQSCPQPPCPGLHWLSLGLGVRSAAEKLAPDSRGWSSYGAFRPVLGMWSAEPATG